MFGLFLSFSVFLCLALLPQVSAIPVVPSAATPDGKQNSSTENSEQVDSQQQHDQQNDGEQREIGHDLNVTDEEVEEPGPSVQTTLMPDSVSPRPCKTKYWCLDNDGKGLEILMEWEKTIVTCERVQNLKRFKPGQRVSRKKLHDAGKTLEEQLAKIEKNKEMNRCMFECVYCGGEYEDLVELKEHVVGVKHKRRYWRVQCVDRLTLDEIEDWKK